MKLLVVGSGGREHALAWKLAQSPKVTEIFVAPGNGGTENGKCKNVDIKANDVAALIAFATEINIDFSVIGPEEPLSLGIVDEFQKAGLRVFGSTKAASQLEASKAFSKDFMVRHGVPTASHRTFTQIEDAIEYVQAINHKVVVKASGLAAGKGVIICDNTQEAEAAVLQIMQDKEFGAAGDECVVEERLEGKECSLLVFCDGKNYAAMPPTRDHKRALDNDEGLNTGGMGAFSPLSDVGPTVVEEALLTCVKPIVDGMAAAGTPYVGILYAGLMLTPNGLKVLEYNCRFGDPETQVVLPLLDSDLLEIMEACVDGKLDQQKIIWKDQACITVVAASGGYPGKYENGKEITIGDLGESFVFHAGTKISDGKVVTAGGRVLSVSAFGKDFFEAQRRAYAGMTNIKFDGMHFRSDIGGSRSEAPPVDASKATPRVDVSDNKKGLSYADSGVDIDAGAKAVELMKDAVKATYNDKVLAGVGSFGGMFDVSFLKNFDAPVLVSSTDGVGTKTKVATQMNKWNTIGECLVNHCVNDILVGNAKPLFFLDYVASSKLEPQKIADIVTGVANACKHLGIVLIGGETAEMPGVYLEGEVDLASTIVGCVEKAEIITGEKIQVGDVVLGLASTGLHTNGYSLGRKALEGLEWSEVRADLGTSIGDALLAVHRPYLHEVNAIQKAGVDIKGMAHITGGGVVENLPRVLPKGVGAEIYRGTFTELPIFKLIQEQGGVADGEMFRAFNMGLGYLIVVSADDLARAKIALPELMEVGKIVSGVGTVTVI